MSIIMNGHKTNHDTTSNDVKATTNGGTTTTTEAVKNTSTTSTVTTTKDERWIKSSYLSSWFREPSIKMNNDGSILTESGLTNIAEHAYKAGECTILDNVINPIWQYLTDNILPLWMAPNLVTVIGLSFCIFSYFISWYYNPNLAIVSSDGDGNNSNAVIVPDEVLILNGICLIIYYTLDCMDGKQARRTKSSSPLGQLLDHGVDCLANIPFSNLVQCCLGLNGLSYVFFQLTLQMGFFQAQWEEYCTGQFQHSVANVFGVTEVVYGLAIWSLITGLAGLLQLGIGDKDFYNQEFTLLSPSTLQTIFPGSSILIDYDAEKIPLIKDIIVLIWSWGYILMLSPLSILRVSNLVDTWSRLLSCLRKMISPTLVSIATIYWSSSQQQQMMMMDSSSTTTTTSFRFPSIAVGLCFCIITNKLIVFGMAKQYYASFQPDIIPCLLAIVLSLAVKNSNKFKVYYYDLLLFGVTTIFYLYRFSNWTYIAIHQLCNKLGIEVFRIKYYNTKQV